MSVDRLAGMYGKTQKMNRSPARAIGGDGESVRPKRLGKLEVVRQLHFWRLPRGSAFRSNAGQTRRNAVPRRLCRRSHHCGVP